MALADPGVESATREDEAVALAMDVLTMSMPEDMLPDAFSARGKQFEARLHGWAESVPGGPTVVAAVEEAANQMELAGARPDDA